MGQETATKIPVDLRLIPSFCLLFADRLCGGSPVAHNLVEKLRVHLTWRSLEATVRDAFGTRDVRADGAAALGTVERKHLSVDISFVEANAAKQSRIPWWTRPPPFLLR